MVYKMVETKGGEVLNYIVSVFLRYRLVFCIIFQNRTPSKDYQFMWSCAFPGCFTLAYLGSSGKLAIFFPRAVRRTCPSFLSTAPSSSKCSTAERTASGVNIPGYYYGLPILQEDRRCAVIHDQFYLEMAWTWNQNSSHLVSLEPWAAASHRLSYTCSTHTHMQGKENNRTGHSITLTYILSFIICVRKKRNKNNILPLDLRHSHGDEVVKFWLGVETVAGAGVLPTSPARSLPCLRFRHPLHRQHLQSAVWETHSTCSVRREPIKQTKKTHCLLFFQLEEVESRWSNLEKSKINE